MCLELQSYPTLTVNADGVGVDNMHRDTECNDLVRVGVSNTHCGTHDDE